jgi:hypothetical protein
MKVTNFWDTLWLFLTKRLFRLCMRHFPKC